MRDGAIVEPSNVTAAPRRGRLAAVVAEIVRWLALPLIFIAIGLVFILYPGDDARPR
jgi:hypothetical protein